MARSVIRRRRIKRRKAASNLAMPAVRGKGTKLGMSLARIFESGTRRRLPAKPAFEPGIRAAELGASDILSTAYSEAISYLWGRGA
jgi:hypothetical protein